MTSESTLQAYASQVILDKGSNEFPNTLQVRLYLGGGKEYEYG
jgi:hypothetical protein